ncbi:MAG: cytochrome o ubiquinol oxidase subunit IV [Chlamydiia bacterium]|nr:cytochrome o ubiquinol oxidase subunit IV [Chlamydiia bacterium]
MDSELSLKQIQKEWHGSPKSYVIGFTASILLTAASFSCVMIGVLSGKALVYTLVGFALVQAIFQLLYFLHLGKEESPRWETLIFGFMVMVLLIVAIGSLWIMSDLNDRVMSDMNQEEMPMEHSH